jgi:hypothetical protein
MLTRSIIPLEGKAEMKKYCLDIPQLGKLLTQQQDDIVCGVPVPREEQIDSETFQAGLPTFMSPWPDVTKLLSRGELLGHSLDFATRNL